ncbi:hypothetical protein AJ79_02582 [Helicocarpus griseus UAMH5409]|uniref:Uncharacterized protein n=1 Tax=Helicocarpus griseus UAMH5409 TaxID=1447875 RepID=A0A2B7Y3E7_9EURO|nr:hypothetical protein AJ79_02582 [Helicocarpus griseus UAMH5409]
MCQTDTDKIQALDIQSFNSTYVNNGTSDLTWAVGIETSTHTDDLSRAVIFHTFYLGVSPAVSFSATISFRACGIVLDGLIGKEHESSKTSTCDDALGLTCQRDLLALARTATDKLNLPQNDAKMSFDLCTNLRHSLCNKIFLRRASLCQT